jgi:hypothetical protein
MRTMIVTLALVIASSAQAVHAQAPVADYFSTSSRIGGAILPAGTVIEAYESDGVRCGHTTANADGSFLMQVYGNDPMTAADEGAGEGEMLQWRLSGQTPDSISWVSNIVGLFADMRFENGAAKQIYLENRPTAVESGSWSGVKHLYRN